MSHSFGENWIFFQSYETKSGAESLGSWLVYTVYMDMSLSDLYIRQLWETVMNAKKSLP